MLNPGHEYYLVVQEWLYPTETGVDKPKPLASLSSCTDDLDAAKAEARGLAEKAAASFAQDTGTDPTPVGELAYCYPNERSVFVVTSKNGLDEWWFAAKVVKATFGVGAAASVVGADSAQVGVCPVCGGKLVDDGDRVYCDTCEYDSTDPSTWGNGEEA